MALPALKSSLPTFEGDLAGLFMNALFIIELDFFSEDRLGIAESKE
jgi:hypothetical protein